MIRVYFLLFFLFYFFSFYLRDSLDEVGPGKHRFDSWAAEGSLEVMNPGGLRHELLGGEAGGDGSR